MGGRRLQSRLCEPAAQSAACSPAFTERRRSFALGTVLCTVGWIGCGCAPDAGRLIVGRAIAGVGAALEVPTTLAILTVTWPDVARARPAARHLGERARGRALQSSARRSAACWSTTPGGACIFLLIVPLCALALWLARRVPESSAPQGRRPRPAGLQTLASLALGSLALTATKARAGIAVSSLSAAAVVRQYRGSRGTRAEPLAFAKRARIALAEPHASAPASGPSARRRRMVRGAANRSRMRSMRPPRDTVALDPPTALPSRYSATCPRRARLGLARRARRPCSRMRSACIRLATTSLGRPQCALERPLGRPAPDSA